MAKKSVDASLAAYPSKGMKAPRPGAQANPGPSAPPSSAGSPHKEPPYDKVSAEMAKDAPSAKKRALPQADAPEGTAGVNGGSPMALPTHLNEKK